MFRAVKTAALTALSAAVLGAGLVGCDGESMENWDPFDSGPKAASFVGAEKLDVDGKSVNVSCSGELADGAPVVVLLHGGGDGADKMAALQKSVSAKHRVCSYDRLGAGASDRPDGPQSFDSAGKVLTGVLDRVAGDRPVVLAGHSLGGLIAARYAPDHQDRVKGLVLMDATPATMVADISTIIPASASGPAGDLRAQNLAIFQGRNPEQLAIEDGPVESAGDVPVEIIKHGQPYLAALPQYGRALEDAWTAGQAKWKGLSSNAEVSVADKAGHYIYTDTPDVAVKAIEKVVKAA